MENRRFYSPQTNGFYTEAVHGVRQIRSDDGGGKTTVPNPHCSIPPDAIEVSDDHHAMLFEGQQAGQEIAFQNWKLQLAERIGADDARAAQNRNRRNRLLQASDWTQLPDALPTAERASWKAYRQQLRDLTLTLEPDGEGWPIPPQGDS